MRFRAARLFLFEPSLVRVAIWLIAQEDSQPTEYQIKAAFIFQFREICGVADAAFQSLLTDRVGVLRRKSFSRRAREND